MSEVKVFLCTKRLVMNPGTSMNWNPLFTRVDGFN